MDLQGCSGGKQREAEGAVGLQLAFETRDSDRLFYLLFSLHLRIRTPLPPSKWYDAHERMPQHPPELDLQPFQLFM